MSTIRRVSGAAGALLLFCCRSEGLQGSRTVGEADSGNGAIVASASGSRGQLLPQAAVAGASAPSAPSAENQPEMFEMSLSAASDAIDEMMGEKALITGEKANVVQFAEGYIDNLAKPFPRPRKFLVESSPGGWTVWVLDLGAIARGQNPPGYTLHVSGKAGQYRIEGASGG